MTPDTMALMVNRTMTHSEEISTNRFHLYTSCRSTGKAALFDA